MKCSDKWHQRQWKRIEEEFQEPAREVVRVMHHEQRVPLCQIAPALGVSEWTLRKWCRDWQLPTRRIGYCATKGLGKVQRRARELGYDSVNAAITALRLNGLQWNEVRRVLHCSDATMCRYLDDAARGFYYLSTRGLAAKRRCAKRLNRINHSGNIPPLRFVTPYWNRRN